MDTRRDCLRASLQALQGYSANSRDQAQKIGRDAGRGGEEARSMIDFKAQRPPHEARTGHRGV